ncbi:sodium:hydrogen exchanger 7 [Echinococcus multilocularis]|uniref:Sodium/hydrogen exchanger n=1 Tax=Echinococcus multilocularis TaxID=6211 RepID=A0A087VZ74_ECHMU|nr:sodium:hydrogen exchanger 7 [Echinococcus multilocularis]
MNDTNTCTADDINEIGRKTQERIEHEHRIDNVYMLTYTILMAFTVLTIWLFKHRRFRYIHETGLAVIYGLIVGAIFRYGVPERIMTTQVCGLSSASSNSCSLTLPPERAIINLTVTEPAVTSRYYHYYLEFESRDTVGAHYRMTFNPEIFFNVLLPPIIFSAGYSMKRKHFFSNFGAITTYAFAGTFLASIVTASLCFGLSRFIPHLNAGLRFSDCLFFGSIISATDPVTVLAIFHDLNVDVDMYALVFGESVLNDAVAISLSQTVDRFDPAVHGGLTDRSLFSAVWSFIANFGSSFLLGSSIGCFTALLTKYTYIRDYPILETVLFVLLSYATFFLSEAVGLTGIVALLFCGVTQAHYTFNNLSRESKVWTKQFFELLSFLAENFVFAYIGVSTFSAPSHNWDIWFILITMLACVVARMCAVYPLSRLINCARRNHCTPRCCRRGSRGLSGVKALQGDVSDNAVFGWQRFHSSPASAPSAATSDANVSEPKGLIGWNRQHMLVFCGLRGAMAFSLSIRNTSTEVRQMFFSTTIFIVIITVLLGGCLAIPMLQWLKIPIYIQGADGRPGDSTDARKKRFKAYYNFCWFKFDSRILKPLLTHSGPLLSETLPRFCLPLADWLTTVDQREAAMSQHYGNSGQEDILFGNIVSVQEDFPTNTISPAALKERSAVHQSLVRIFQGGQPYPVYSSLTANPIALQSDAQATTQLSNGSVVLSQSPPNSEHPPAVQHSEAETVPKPKQDEFVNL